MKRFSSEFYRRTVAALLAVAVISAAAAPLWAQEAPDSPPEAISLFNSAARLLNRGAYPAAVDDYRKFLKKYPNDRLALKARYYLGMCLNQLGKWEEATQELETVFQGGKEFQHRADALLTAASAYYSLGLSGKKEAFEKAAGRFQDLVTEFPAGGKADEALYFQGESLYNLGKLAEAVKAYGNVVKNHADSQWRADTLYALGTTQEELKDYAAAGATYDIFLKEFSDHELTTAVKLRKAEVLLNTDKAGEAEKLFAVVASTPGFDDVALATFRQAQCNYRLRDYAKAGKLFAEVVTKYDQSEEAEEAAFWAGLSFFYADDLDNAAKWLDKVVQVGGKQAVQAAHQRCLIYLRKGEPAPAAELAGSTIPKATDSPFLPSLIMDQADGLYAQPEKRAKSLPLYLKICTDHPDHDSAPQALYNAAFAALDLEQFDDALTHASAFIEKHADHDLLVDAKYVTGESLLRLKKYAESEQKYREVVAAAGDHPELDRWQVRLGLVLSLQKKNQDVVDLLTPLLTGFKAADAKAEGHFLVGTAELLLGKPADAEKSLGASLAANPSWAQSDEVWLNLSRAQRKQDKNDAAITSVKRVLADFPDSRVLDRAHYRLGEYSAATGDYKTAIAEYDQVLANWPDSAFYLYSLYGKGWAQLNSKAYAEAGETFTSFIDKYPDHERVPRATRARATCRYQAKDYAGAIEDVNAFLKSEPGLDDRVDALYVRGLSESASKEYDDAAESFKSIWAEKPDFEKAARVLYELGWARKLGGHDDKAVGAFTLITTKHPDDPLAAEAFYHVGQVQYDAKNYADAVVSYTASRDKASNADLTEKAVYKLGWAQYQLKAYEEALAAFSDQVAKYPEGTYYCEGLFMNGECLFKLEQHEEALPVFTKCLELDEYSDAIRTTILLHAGQSASQTEDWKQASELFGKIPAEYPKSSFVPEAFYEQGFAQQNLNQADEAKKLYAQAADADLARSAIGARARFMLGELYFGEKDYDAAIKEFQRVIFTYGDENSPAELKKWQAKSAYETGRCNDVQIKGAKTPAERQKFIDEAKKFYQTLLDDFPDSDEAPSGKQRLEELKKL